MEPINWYLMRHYVKWTLTSVTILFFLVTVVQLLIVKQFYIKRYIEMHLEEESDSTLSFDGRHKVFQVDEEIDLTKFNLTEHSAHTTNDSAVGPHGHGVVSMLNETIEHNGSQEENRYSTEVKFYTGITVAAIILIEMLYCMLYLYIIGQKRFCSMMCFATLSLLSLLFHVQLHFTIPVESMSGQHYEHHQAATFLDHVDSLEVESLINHISRSSMLEVVLSTVETILALVYSALLYKFPGRQRSHHHRLAGFLRLGGGRHRRADPMIHNNGRLANGHAVAIEMNSVDEANDSDHNGDVDCHSQSSLSISSSASDHANGHQQMADGRPSTATASSNSGEVQSPPLDDGPLIDGAASSAHLVVR